MELLNFVRDYWVVILGIGTVIAWNAKQQSDINHLKQDHAEHKSILWAKMDALQLSLHSLIGGIARLEGKWEANEDHRNHHRRS